MKRLIHSLAVVVVLAVPARGAAPATIIRGATVIDGSGGPPLQDAALVIEGGRITAVGPRRSTKTPKGARVIDAKGKFITPGLADMHNHLRDGASGDWINPRRAIGPLFAWGITMVFAPGLDPEVMTWLRMRAAPDDKPYGRFFSTGPMFMGGGKHGADYTPATPAEARTHVLQLKAANVDGVKVIYDDASWLISQAMPVMPPDVMATVIDEAHKQGLKVYVHAPILSYAKATLRAGADVLMHSVISDPVDDEFIALMKQNHATYIATLALFESAADFAAWTAREQEYDVKGMVPKERFEKARSPDTVKKIGEQWTKAGYVKEQLPVARANLKKVFDAGIPVVIGSDTGLMGVILGVSSHLELLLNVEAGLTPSDVLRAATLNAAAMVGREKDLGSVAVGKWADLLILDADPLADIRNTRRIHRIIRAGVVHDPAQVPAEVERDTVTPAANASSN